MHFEDLKKLKARKISRQLLSLNKSQNIDLELGKNPNKLSTSQTPKLSTSTCPEGEEDLDQMESRYCLFN